MKRVSKKREGSKYGSSLTGMASLKALLNSLMDMTVDQFLATAVGPETGVRFIGASIQKRPRTLS